MEGKATDVFFVRSIPGQRTPRTVSVSSYEVAGIEYMFANNQSPLRSSLSYLYHIIDNGVSPKVTLQPQSLPHFLINQEIDRIQGIKQEMGMVLHLQQLQLRFQLIYSQFLQLNDFLRIAFG